MAQINHDAIKNSELAVSFNWQIVLASHCPLMKTNFPELIAAIGNGDGGKVNILCETCTPPSSTIEATTTWIRGIKINQAMQQKSGDTFEAVFYDTDKRHLFKYFKYWKDNAIKEKNQAAAAKISYALAAPGLVINQLSGIENSVGEKDIVGVYTPDMVYPSEVKESELNGDNQFTKVTVTFVYSICNYV